MKKKHQEKSIKSNSAYEFSPAKNEQGAHLPPPAYGLDFTDTTPLQKTGEDSSKGPLSHSSPNINNTGLPDKLKINAEALSGYSLDDVKVHFNSSKPSEVNALAYAQGNDIHLGPGQEKHLPHETWHIVQQKQGRVKANTQFGNLAGNDEVGLEREADRMGGKINKKPSSSKALKSSVGPNRQDQTEIVQRLSIKENPIDFQKVKSAKPLKDGKVVLLTGNDGGKIVLKVENVPFQSLEIGHQLIPDISGARVPEIRQLSMVETMQLSSILTVNTTALKDAHMARIATDVTENYVYAMEFIEGESLENLKKGDEELDKAMSILANLENQTQLGMLHAVDLFLGNKDRGLINLGNWKFDNSGNIVALDNADANSYANKFLGQKDRSADQNFQIQQDFKATLNKLIGQTNQDQEAKRQFEEFLPKQLAALTEVNQAKVLSKIQKKLAPYNAFKKGMEKAVFQIYNKIVTGNTYAGKPWNEDVYGRATKLSDNPQDHEVDFMN